MNYENSYFDNEPEYYHDAYGETEKLEKKVGKPLTIAEIKKFMKKRTHVTYDKEEMELLVDNKTGLLYTEELNAVSAELLINHCLVEQCMEHRKMVDWERVTDKYDYKLIEKIDHIFIYPLTWVYPPAEIGYDSLVWGLLAVSKPCEDRYSLSTYSDFFSNLRELSIRWFATNLPTKNDIRGVGRDYHMVPDDMVLWDRICSYGIDCFSRKDIFRPETLRKNIEFIAENFGAARAAKIIRLLREDWQDIVIRKLFDIDELDSEQIEEFRQNLFEGMDRSLRKWDAETPKVEEPKPAKKKPAQQDRTYITFTMSGITVGHIDMLRQKLIQVGWIAKDTLPDDFYKLFSGKTNSTKIIWTGAVGKGMLLFLFQKMVDQGEIVVPDNHSITTILESHFVDEHGIYISGLNSSKESSKHFPIVKECLDILQLEVNND